MTDAAASRCSIRRDGAIDDPPEELEKIRGWMLDHHPKLKPVFDPVGRSLCVKRPR